MTTNQEGFQLLDQLQNEVNRVLEQTGRLFAAAKDDPRTVPVVQISKLKELLPGSIDRFHNALDQFEDELQTAKLVMRRDLALCRERTGIQPPPQPNGGKENGEVAKPEEVSAGQVVALDQPTKSSPAEDVAMEDAQPSKPPEPEQLVDKGTADNEGAVNSPKQDKKMDEHSTEVVASPQTYESAQKQTDSALLIDTQTQPKKERNETGRTDEDRAPDTGINTNDLDSLFGGPTSAGPGENTDFQTQFDFGDFGGNLDSNAADNDNISALLPGLQDYANTQPTGSGETDFDALFSTGLPMTNDGQDGEQQGSRDHRESTFDDLLDFADFNPGDFTAGTGGNNPNENQDVDFSFD